MKYIKRITLKNFQSHKHSVIDLDERLNVIVGSSDSGKSAIIRGIKWALYNEPSGDYFIREGEKDCSVTLEFNDNSILKRYRSKSKNSYILTNNNGEEIKFEGFGSAVPAEIIDTIGIKKIHLDSEESDSINLGEQLDGAFLLSEKTSTRASAIGRLVGVNIIDDALREVLKDTRALNISKKGLEENVMKLGEEIDKFHYLDDLNLKLNKLNKIKVDINNKNLNLEKLSLAKNKLIEINLGLTRTKELVDKLKTVDELNKIIIVIENKIFKYKYLNSHNNNLNRIKNDTSENDFIKLKLKDLNQAYDTVTRLEMLNFRYYQLDKLQKKNAIRSFENSKLDQTLSKLNRLKELNHNIEEITNLNLQLLRLESNRIKYKGIITNLNAGNIYLNKLSELDKVNEKMKKIEEKSKILIKLTNLYKILLTNNQNLKEETKSIWNINATIKNDLENYQELLKKLEICPFCLSDIDEYKINHIINHYIGG